MRTICAFRVLNLINNPSPNKVLEEFEMICSQNTKKCLRLNGWCTEPTKLQFQSILKKDQNCFVIGNKSATAVPLYLKTVLPLGFCDILWIKCRVV